VAAFVYPKYFVALKGAIGYYRILVLEEII